MKQVTPEAYDALNRKGEIVFIKGKPHIRSTGEPVQIVARS